MKRRQGWLFFIIFLLTLSVYLLINYPLQLGLDLQGGSQLTLQIIKEEGKVTRDELEAVNSVIDKRVNNLGVSESNLQTLGGDQLILELPGEQNPLVASRVLGKTALLEFRIQKLGTSSNLKELQFQRLNINDLIGDRFLISLGIASAALVVSYIIAIPVGIISATTEYKSLDLLLKLISYLGLALPSFLVALCIMLFLTIYFGDTMTGLFSPEYEKADWSMDKFVDFLSRAWLPIVVLGWNATAFTLQTVRALMLDENDNLYVMAAKARGVSGFNLLWKYPARHSMGPVINSVGFDLNRIFSF